ncbi:MAG TPA: hypothetical protein VMV22_08840 [Acidimicrobiales bacterium]|nr:hypothetical protein [Acidimicrobiales bacterium]
MSAGWVAAEVRGRGLCRRRIGAGGARELAASPSLARAVEALARTPYGHDVRPGMDRGSAQHAVTATLVWHLRVLAGWGPAVAGGGLRVLATGIEIDNVAGHLAGLAGYGAEPPFRLGALSTAWPRVSGARTPEEVRRALATSAWGDPGTGDPSAVRLALEITWARRVADGAPAASRWAASYAAMVIGRALVTGALASLGAPQRRDARRVLGDRWAGATTLPELARSVPRSAAWVLHGIEGPEDLWRAEARWWATVEKEGSDLVGRSRAGEASTVGAFGLLAADAWRARGALEIAARGGAEEEVLDAVG